MWIVLLVKNKRKRISRVKNKISHVIVQDYFKYVKDGSNSQKAFSLYPNQNALLLSYRQASFGGWALSQLCFALAVILPRFNLIFNIFNVLSNI